MNLGFAPPRTIRRTPASRTATAPAYAVPGAIPSGPLTLVTYHGPTRPDLHGTWWLDGWCPCQCGRLTMWCQERYRARRLFHVSPDSVTTWRAGR